MYKKLTLDEFIINSKKIHGDKYDYSKVKYINSRTKVCIVCPIHGEFWQTPINHVNNKHNCPLCSHQSFKDTKENFIIKSKKIHGNKYDYSKVNYINSKTKVCIICPIHGEFNQTPNGHLNGQSCPKCSKNIFVNKKHYTNNDFIEKSKLVHGNKYDYYKVNYVNSRSKVCIICHKHGEFWQEPSSHLRGNGCPKCSNKNLCTTDEFIQKSKKIHGNKYDYSHVNYINNRIKVCIICPKHGEFLQTPNAHLNGNGCPHCNKSKIENEIKEFLELKNIKFTQQKKFTWLGKQSLDFYLPDYNTAIECQGEQHFKPFRFDKNKLLFNKIVKRDIRKRELCNVNGVKLLYYSNLRIEYPYDVFENKYKLLKIITK